MKKKIALCIAVFNEEKTIAATIESIFSQQSSGEFFIHVFIIASGCTDLTIPIINTYVDQGFPIDVIEEKYRSGKSNALNILIEIITRQDYEISIFTDGDVILNKDALYQLIWNFLSDDSLDAIAGHPIPITGLGFWHKIAQENCDVWHFTRKKLSETFSTWPLSGYLYAIRTKALVEIPSDVAVDDSFLGLNIILNGGKIAYSEKAVVFIGFPKNFFDYYQQKSRTRYGWRQLSVISILHYQELKRIQAEVIRQRISAGNYWSLISWLFDFSIRITDEFWSWLRANPRAIWDPVPSSKLLDHKNPYRKEQTKSHKT